MFTNGAVVSKHNTIYTDDHINTTKVKEIVNFNGDNYFTKTIKHTNDITNNITRHIHNKFEPNASKKNT